MADRKVKFILFLDFDGVTHPITNSVPSNLDELRRFGLYGDGPYFRKDNVLQVNRLIHKLDASVVITSTWRLDFGWKPFKNLFLGRVIGQTPEIDFSARYKEIQIYLEKNKYQDRSWLALDDNPSLYPVNTPSHITNGNVGLTTLEVNNLISQYK
ncbi:MAG: HAD domain-containing protein [Candidatus Thiodiazotropha lotti]|nr:HAD domain-containing protein [Candidatus Thiodiazotropha lotti]MCW4220738.1 HAD domain-containing protein [Candidatus Thiodiazotropha lotti]